MLERDAGSMVEEVKHKEKSPSNKLKSQTTFQVNQIKMWLIIKYGNGISN